MLRTYSLGRDVQYEDVTAARALALAGGPGGARAARPAPPATEHSFVTGEHGLYVAT